MKRIRRTKRMEALIDAAFHKLLHDADWQNPDEEAYEIAEWLRQDFRKILANKEVT